MKAIAALLDIIPGWIYAIALSCVLAVCVTQEMRVGAYKARLSAEQKAHADTKLSYANALAAAQAQARATEAEIRGSIDQLRKTKDAQITALRADVRTLRERLSDLSARPAGDTGPAASFGQAPQGCPGPILYRDTAEALADEAERADLIRINLQACYAAWDAARDSINGSQPDVRTK